MTAIVIGIILFFFIGVLFFTIALCRGAAMADRAYERARLDERRAWPMSAELLEAHKELHDTADSKPATTLEHSKVRL
jgi:hypothetical protein